MTPTCWCWTSPPPASTNRDKESFHAILRQLRETRGVTILLVSHDIGVVFHEANKVACVNYRLQCYAHPDDISDLDLATVYGHTADVVVHRHR